MSQTDSIKRIAAEAMRRYAPEARVVDVEVRPDQSEEGDPICWADVVYEVGRPSLGPDVTIPVRGEVVERVVASGDAGYPLLSFVAARDLRGRTTAVA